MADLTITATSVLASTGAQYERTLLAGETITAGMVVYKKTSDQRWWKAQSDGTAEEAGGSTVLGIALVGAAAGQPIVVQTAGIITIGSTPTVGTIYVVSTTAGGIAPWADLNSTHRVTIIGYGHSSTQLGMHVKATGVQIP